MEAASCTRTAASRSSRVAEFSRENSAEGRNSRAGRKGIRSARSPVAKRSTWMGASGSSIGGTGSSPVAKRFKWMGRTSAKHFANAVLSFSLSADLLSWTETRASMVSYVK